MTLPSVFFQLFQSGLENRSPHWKRAKSEFPENSIAGDYVSQAKQTITELGQSPGKPTVAMFFSRVSSITLHLIPQRTTLQLNSSRPWSKLSSFLPFGSFIVSQTMMKTESVFRAR